MVIYTVNKKVLYSLDTAEMSLKFEVRLCGSSGDRHAYIVHHRHGADHRSGGRPATIWVDEDMFWYEYDLLHRLNGPAEIYDGKKRHYIRGKRQ